MTVRGMRALLFAYYFPPMGGMGSLRALGLARHLPEAGVDLTVVAPRTGTYGRDPSLSGFGPARVVRTGTLEPGLLLRRSAGRSAAAVPAREAGARRRRLLRGLAGRFINVPDSNVGWIPHAVRAGLLESRHRRPDVVLSSAPPLSAHLAAALVARRLRVPLVADFRDFFATQRLYGGLRSRIDRRIEDFVLCRSAAVTAPTEGILEVLRARTGAPSLLVRNGYDEEDFADPAAVSDGPFRLVHVGSTYASRISPLPLFRAVADVAAAGVDLRLGFVGVADPALTACAREAGVLDRTEFESFTSHREAVAGMRSASALLHFVWAGDPVVARGAFPGKTFEYLRCGRPVLALGPAGGETARALREIGGALLRESTDREGIREALTDLAEGRHPSPVPTARLLPFTRRHQARRLAAWLSDLVASRR